MKTLMIAPWPNRLAEVLDRVRQPRPDDAETVEAGDRHEVQHQGEALDEAKKCQRSEKAEVAGP